MAIASVAEVKAHYGYSDARAKQFLDGILAEALENQQGNKGYRPWDIVDFRKKLDPNKSWIGFEFETGFDNKKDYQKFINMLWQQDYTAIDREGTGNFPVEVAFAPMLADDVLAGNSTLEQAIKFIHDNKLVPALNPTTFTRRDVGCHAGVSTAKYRALGDGAYRICQRLNAILINLTDEQKKTLYNRTALLWGGAHARRGYIEIKTFRAVPEVEAVQKYIRVTGQIVKLVDILIDNQNLALTREQAFLFLSTDADEVK